MKKALCAFLLVIAVSNSFSQEPEFKSGSSALLFSFYGFAWGEWVSAGRGDSEFWIDDSRQVAEFENGIGAKYFVSELTAIRIGIQFAGGSATIPANPLTGQQGTDGKVSATMLGFSAVVELHATSGFVSPYIGGGISYCTINTEESTIEVGNPPSPPDTRRNSANGVNIRGDYYRGETMINVYALAGFELFVWKDVSLAGEYRFGFGSTSRKEEKLTSGNITTTTMKLGGSSRFEISSQALLTLAVYFP